MSFTAELGTPDSYPGNIALGFAPVVVPTIGTAGFAPSGSVTIDGPGGTAERLAPIGAASVGRPDALTRP